MDVTLLKALAALVPAGLLLGGAMTLLFGARTVWSVLQVIGAGGLVVVILAHICEALRLLPWMGWGLERSPGHYLDLSCAVLGVMFFSVGYFVDALTKRRSHISGQTRRNG